ncbi:MAG: efflux RND transporter periplasmic adaptor subunit [bacterium]|nr:efflux RND transporter periplasmic adaptor subunit [bacterium]
MKIVDNIHKKALAGGIAVLLIISGCGEKRGSGGPPQERPAPEVGFVEVKPEPVTITMELPGRTSAYLLAEVRPQIGGIILKRYFTEGAHVKAEQRLYQIDPAPYQAALDNAEAVLARAEANILPARLKEERFRELVEIKAVSRQEYDDAEAALKEAEAEVASARAAVETSRINLAYTGVKAPISGRIGRSAVTPGALVTAGQALPLATIQKLDPIYVDVTRSSADLLRLQRDLAEGNMSGDGSGQAKVKLKLEDGKPYRLEGIMKFSEVMVDQGTGSVTLRALFPNPNRMLLPGMFVRAVVQEGVREKAILVSQRGVTRNPRGEALAMIVGEGEKVEPRIIKVSRTIGDKWLVTEGLKAGDRVIIEGLQRARPGTVVKAFPVGVPPETQPAVTQQSPPEKE